MPGRQLTQNFHTREFACNDGTPVPSKYWDDLEDLCRVFLEPMRRKFGACTINSGFRTDEWNDKVGGARFSFHVYTDRPPGSGVAADVKFKTGSPAQWARKDRRIRRFKRGGRGGVGEYPQGGFTHVDNRNYKADWDGP